MEHLNTFVTLLNDFLYGKFLITLLIVCGLTFTIATRCVQLRLFLEIFRVLFEKKKGKNDVSSFQALMVSTASRVGTGNIVGVSAAICLGGFGAVPWMWLIAMLGMASAFAETVLAQIFKKKSDKGAFGGPAYYIEFLTKNRLIPLLFILALISTFMVGFNMLASYNIQDSFSGFDFYNKETSPIYIGLILTTVVGYVLLGGGERIIKFATLLVPFMGLIYISISAFVVFNNIEYLPEMFKRMFSEAFDFQAIFGGFTGSCVMYGIKRALFSNEAGMGSAPNAAGCADVSHPVKQGLVQVFSVFLDTMIICTATALMCLSSGIEPSAELNGVPYVLKVAESAFGSYGNIIIAVTITLFAFTTIIGNLFYVDKSFFYIFRTVPNKSFFLIYRLFATFIVMIGALLSSDLLWGIADITMGCMALINVVTIVFLSKYVVGALKDYQEQKKQGLDPHFKASSIGLEGQTDYWK